MGVKSETTQKGHLHESWHVPAFRKDFWRGRSHRWCVVIPVINEGTRIQSLLKRLGEASIATLADVLIIDGGSTDGSLERRYLEEGDVRGLLIKTGPGKLSAQLLCAYAFALGEGYDGIITIDGNNKDDPGDIPKFVEALERGVDFVQASRFIPGGYAENTPRLREIAIRMVHAPLLSLASGFRWTDTTQGFRAYSRRLLSDPQVAPFRKVFSRYELLAYLSYRAPRLRYHCEEIATKRIYPKGKVPTKISSFRGNIDLIRVLISACLGRYNPNTYAKYSNDFSPS